MTQYRDEHTGPVYRYALRRRPRMPGITCPRDGYLIVMPGDRHGEHPDYPHGVACYSRPLTIAEVAAYELHPLETMEPAPHA